MHYFAIYKPFGILSQFSDEGHKKGLGSVFDLPPNVYPVGRLDADSEGLLLLTDDTSINHQLLNPRFGHTRTYWVQVEGAPAEEDLKRFASPMELKFKKNVHKTLPAQAEILDAAQFQILPERNPPIRVRQSIPDTWIALLLTEGKNRQVRKMTAHVGYPTLRLVRFAIEKITLEDLGGASLFEFQKAEFFRKLNL